MISTALLLLMRKKVPLLPHRPVLLPPLLPVLKPIQAAKTGSTGCLRWFLIWAKTRAAVQPLTVLTKQPFTFYLLPLCLLALCRPLRCTHHEGWPVAALQRREGVRYNLFIYLLCVLKPVQGRKFHQATHPVCVSARVRARCSRPRRSSTSVAFCGVLQCDAALQLRLLLPSRGLKRIELVAESAAAGCGILFGKVCVGNKCQVLKCYRLLNTVADLQSLWRAKIKACFLACCRARHALATEPDSQGVTVNI